MVKWFSLFILGIVLGALSVLPGCAPKEQKDCGFVQNVYNQRISWKGKMPIVLSIHQSVPVELHEAIRKAIAKWEAAAGHPVFRIEAGGAVLSETPLRDNRNVIYFLNSWEANKDTEQGRTSVHWIGDEIMEADVRINAKNFTFYWGNYGDPKGPKAVNFEALIIHELGHVLGLRHRDNEGSVMETYLSTQSDRVSISSVDQQAVKCEY